MSISHQVPQLKQHLNASIFPSHSPHRQHETSLAQHSPSNRFPQSPKAHLGHNYLSNRQGELRSQTAGMKNHGALTKCHNLFQLPSYTLSTAQEHERAVKVTMPHPEQTPTAGPSARMRWQCRKWNHTLNPTRRAPTNPITRGRPTALSFRNVRALRSERGESKGQERRLPTHQYRCGGAECQRSELVR